MNSFAHQLSKNQHSQVAYLQAKTLLEKDEPATIKPVSKTNVKMQDNEKIAKQPAALRADAVKKAPWHQRLARSFTPSSDEENSTTNVQMVVSQSLMNARR